MALLVGVLQIVERGTAEPVARAAAESLVESDESPVWAKLSERDGLGLDVIELVVSELREMDEEQS